jgi:serine/threonine protein phosphatase PrpC
MCRTKEYGVDRNVSAASREVREPREEDGGEEWSAIGTFSGARRMVAAPSEGTIEATHAKVEVDTLIDRTRPGDVYLLCSDGLSGLIEHQELTAILLEHRDLCRTASHLVERANELGGTDNITAVLVRVSESTR